MLVEGLKSQPVKEMGSKQRVLVVEDEEDIRDLISLHLLRNGYDVKEAGDGEEAMHLLRVDSFDLALLDWMIPKTTGIQILEYIRSQKELEKMGAIVVTARVEPDDIVHALNRGANDYITKPFVPKVLMARVENVLKWKTAKEGSLESVAMLSHGPLVVDRERYTVNLHNKPLHLTPSEFKLLVSMLENRGKVLTRDRLIADVQGEGVAVVGRTVDTHVFGLRKKLEDIGDSIETIRGVGYRIKDLPS